MRIRHSLVIIAFVSAVLGAAVSPSIAGPKKGSASAADGNPWKDLDDLAYRGMAVEKISKIPGRGGRFPVNSGEVTGVKGVVTGNHLNGTSSTTHNGDWSSGGHGGTATKTVAAPKTIAATTTNQTLYKPVHSLGVKPSR